jgi:hypothetical protein
LHKRIKFLKAHIKVIKYGFNASDENDDEDREYNRRSRNNLKTA